MSFVNEDVANVKDFESSLEIGLRVCSAKQGTTASRIHRSLAGGGVARGSSDGAPNLQVHYHLLTAKQHQQTPLLPPMNISWAASMINAIEFATVLVVLSDYLVFPKER